MDGKSRGSNRKNPPHLSVRVPSRSTLQDTMESSICIYELSPWLLTPTARACQPRVHDMSLCSTRLSIDIHIRAGVASLPVNIHINLNRDVDVDNPLNHPSPPTNQSQTPSPPQTPQITLPAPSTFPNATQSPSKQDNQTPRSRVPVPESGPARFENYWVSLWNGTLKSSAAWSDG